MMGFAGCIIHIMCVSPKPYGYKSVLVVVLDVKKTPLSLEGKKCNWNFYIQDTFYYMIFIIAVYGIIVIITFFFRRMTTME